METNIKTEARLLAIETVKELIVKFHKSITEAEDIVKNSGMEEYIVEHPIALHSPSYDWAVTLLTQNNDLKALEKYLT